MGVLSMLVTMLDGGYVHIVRETESPERLDFLYCFDTSPMLMSLEYIIK